MTLPSKLSVAFSARRKDPLLLREAGELFHNWIARGELNDILIDVADYQHVPCGPGVLLIGSQCNYQLKVDSFAQLHVVCWQKQEFSPTICPLTEVFTRAVRVCALLEEESNRCGLFDPFQVNVTSRNRLETDRLTFCVEEFSWHIRQSLAKALQTVPTVTAQRVAGALEFVAKWDANRSMRGVNGRLHRCVQNGEVA